MLLEEQFRAGIRALDIRTWHSSDTFLIFHGDIFQFATFSQVLQACNNFLEQNPSETILLWVGTYGVPDPSDNTRPYYQTFLSYRDSELGARISRTIVGNRYDAPLGEARGKIVIIEDFPCSGCGPDPSFPNYGLNGNGDSILNRQGGSTFYGTAVSVNTLWNNIREHFQVIDASSGMLQNSLAGSGGLYPIDAADGFLGIEGMNSRTLKYLFHSKQRRTGLLWMDFPGPSLISAVIAHNMRFATNITALAGDFGKMVEEVSYAMTDDGDDASAARAKQLQAFLKHVLPGQHWSVLVSGTLGSDNWGYSVVSDGLIHKTDWIDGYSHVVINARELNADITSHEILTYLTPQLLGTLSGDAVARASGLRDLLRTRFPWARWNVAVKRLPFEDEQWGTALDAAASTSVLMVDDGEVYLCTAWATVGFNRAPVANAGSDYVGNEGSVITFNASSSTDPDGDALQYRWDFDGDGTWDTARSSDPVVSWTPSDNLSTIAKLEAFDGALTHVTEFPVKSYNVAPVVLVGGPAIVGKDLKLNRECQVIDPGADTWEMEIRYGDGDRTRVPLTGKMFNVEHTYRVPGDYVVEIRLTDDDGGLGTATLTVQAGANQAPVANAGSDYAGNEGTAITFDGSASTDPDGDPLQYRWDFDGDGTWDTARSADPVVSWTYNDNLSTLAKLEVFDGELTAVADFPVTIRNVAPVVEAGGPATVAKNSKLTRECQFIDPGADTWEIEISYGDGTTATVPHTGKTFAVEHTYPAPGDYVVEIRVLDDDGGLGNATFPVQVEVEAPNLISLTRLPNGAVRLNFAGTPNRSYAIQASTSLSSLNWMSLGTVAAAANGLVTFDDADAPNHATRFYRTTSAQ